MPKAVDRLTYVVAQAARVGWYFGQYRLAARLSAGSMPRRSGAGPVPGTAAILADLRGLFEREWRNIAAGRYRMPHDLVRHPGRLLGEARAFFADLPDVNRRRRARTAVDLPKAAAAAKLPPYYLRNFHYQTDGYLSARSAQLYDHQVEVLFGGGADAMRRQALVPIGEHLRTRRAAECRLLDIGCGTGQFLGFLRDNHPTLQIAALDLSAPYLAEARRRTRRWRRINFVQGAAEALPLADSSLDLVTCIFLFHELPRPVRRRAAGEIGRVLRPGGRLVLVDSLQQGDRPEYDGLLAYFPQAFHEPYYADYIRQDLSALFGAAGLRPVSSEPIFLAKLAVLEKP